MMAIRAYQKFTIGKKELYKKMPANMLFWKQLKVHDTEFLIKMICCLDKDSCLCYGSSLRAMFPVYPVDHRECLLKLTEGSVAMMSQWWRENLA